MLPSSASTKNHQEVNQLPSSKHLNIILPAIYRLAHFCTNEDSRPSDWLKYAHDHTLDELRSISKKQQRDRHPIFLPLFNPTLYRRKYDDGPSDERVLSRKTITDLQIDFISHGFKEGRPAFSTLPKKSLRALFAKHIDKELYSTSCRANGVTAPKDSVEEHYLAAGFLTNLVVCSSGFSESEYLRYHQDIANHLFSEQRPFSPFALISGWHHYLVAGEEECRPISTPNRPPQKGHQKSIQEKLSNIPQITSASTEPREEESDEYDWLTRPVSIEKSSEYDFMIAPPITLLPDKRVNSLVVILHRIDRKIIFGGLSAFFKFLDAYVQAAEISLIKLILTDSNNMIAVLKEISHKSHPLERGNLANLAKEVYLQRWEEPLEIPFNKADRIIAYNAKSSYIASAFGRICEIQTPFTYFIQEDETIFHPNGSISAAIRESYSLACVKIVNSDRLLAYMKCSYPGRFDHKTYVFEHKYIRPSHTISHSNKKDIIVVYFRPEAHAARNCGEIIMAALRLFVANYSQELSMRNLKFIGIGSFGSYSINIGDSTMLTVYSKMSLEEYSTLLKDCLAGISLMDAPHPSVVPFEMAAHGIYTVSNEYINRDKEWLSSKSPYILASSLTPESISECLWTAVQKGSRSRTNRQLLDPEPGIMEIEAEWKKEMSALARSIVEAT